MINKSISTRQALILSTLVSGREYRLSDIIDALQSAEDQSSITVRRDLIGLISLGLVAKSGQLKGTSYHLTIKGLLFAPINPTTYMAIEADLRTGTTTYNFNLFGDLPNQLFTADTLKSLNHATTEFQAKTAGASEVIRQKELERFVIELSWKSSSIEGNTYSLLDTERLMQDGIEAAGHTHDEAVMILNHKQAFQYIMAHTQDYQQISVAQITNIHQLLVDGLGIASGLRSKPVGVTGSRYVPLSVSTQLGEALLDLCQAINRLVDPYSKALLALIGISYIQPFEDGNKRTARLLANAILLTYQLAPLSYRSVDVVTYRESMLVFYEKNSLVPMRNIFVEQYLFACQQYLKFI
jgi:fido (protein-threonine AMPylation protein)